MKKIAPTSHTTNLRGQSKYFMPSPSRWRSTQGTGVTDGAWPVPGGANTWPQNQGTGKTSRTSRCRRGWPRGPSWWHPNSACRLLLRQVHGLLECASGTRASSWSFLSYLGLASWMASQTLEHAPPLPQRPKYPSVMGFPHTQHGERRSVSCSFFCHSCSFMGNPFKEPVFSMNLSWRSASHFWFSCA